jgi:hypothetical protein
MGLNSEAVEQRTKTVHRSGHKGGNNLGERGPFSVIGLLSNTGSKLLLVLAFTDAQFIIDILIL